MELYKVAKDGKSYAINKIYLFNEKEAKFLIELGREKVNFKSTNIYNEEINEEDYIQDVLLNDEITRKLKIDLKSKNSFIVKSPKEIQNYYSYLNIVYYDLYININNNIEEVNETEELKPYIEEGKTERIKHISIKGKNNFKILVRDSFYQYYRTWEEVKDFSYHTLKDAKIEDKIKREEEFKKELKGIYKLRGKEAKADRFLNFLKQKQEEGFLYMIHRYLAKNIYINEFELSRTLEIIYSEERKKWDKFKGDFAKEFGQNYIFEGNIKDFLKANNLDWHNIKFTKNQ